MKMNKVILLLLGLVLPISFTYSQKNLPQDFIDAEFHKSRREALRQMMPENSVAIVFANPVRNRANDVDYIYHQDPDFYYLTGYREPHSVCLIFSEMQQGPNGEQYNELIFVQPRDPMSEMWDGRRLGAEKVKEQLGFEYAFENKDFLKHTLEYAAFDKVLFVNVHDDVRDGGDQADMHGLIAHFKEKTGLQDDYDEVKQQVYNLIKTTDQENNANVATVIDRVLTRYPEFKNDQLINRYQQAPSLEVKIQVASEVPQTNLDGVSLAYMMNNLREVKTEEELKILRKAIDISAMGQVEVMKAMHPGMSETEIQGIHEFVFKKYGAEYEGYPSIVGAGANGCILHYIENNNTHIDSNELVLMDLGAEYRGYTADVTRTIPSSGKFSKEQRIIYNIVLKAQQAGFEACKVGAPFKAPHQAAQHVINQGLYELGIIKSVNERHLYFPHGTSHYLGLDVHDRGNYGNFRENTVITVEPGIYIPEGSDCDKKWWGIAVRIEDDILITEDGYENLSAKAPRSVEEIEALMAQPSVLDDFKLPEL
jgi:Xaa-Pro aminopeptidase